MPSFSVYTNVGTATNITLYPLLSGTLYYVRLYAYDDLNNVTNSTWYSNSTLNALPTLTSPNVTAPKVDGLNVKGKSSDTFIFQITYSDVEGNEPGLATTITNAVSLQIYTNDSSPAYAARVVYTNGGTINYTNGYIFTFTAAATEQLEFQTSPTTKITNSLANICASWAQVSYHWEANAVKGNTNYVEYPTNKPYPTITIDDTPPAGVTVTENNITVDSTKIIWTASSSSDLALSPYTLEWGTSITYGSSSSALSQTTKFYNITGLEQNTKYYYKLTISDDVGNTVEETGDFTTIEVPGACVTEAYAYPSIADKGESIQFTYAKVGTEIKIYNITGALIETVNANSFNIGEWIPKSDIAAGIYFAVYENKAGEKKEIKFVYGVKK